MARQYPVNLTTLYSTHRRSLLLAGLIAGLLIFVSGFHWINSDALLASQQDFDRRNLREFFAAGSFDNDLVLDTYHIPAQGPHDKLINLHLLGLQRERLAYLAKKDGNVVAVAVPATAEDGFNGTIDLLVAVDMFGRISAARVIEDINSNSLYGVVDVIESRWMERFSGNAMRDIKRISWQTIPADHEYDQFVGASITPKAVADRIYNAMVFFQSNRIALMAGENK
jgi:Na+-translocating ferredoxin:NAD+ oxidoreductase subunit G